MNSTPSSADTNNCAESPGPIGKSQPLPADAPAAARSAMKLLSRLKHGTLTLQLPGGGMQRFGSGGAPMASLYQHNWKV